MKFSHVLAGAALVLSLGTGIAAAQDATIVIAPDQATVVHEFVLKHKPKVVTVPSGFTVAVGAVLPADVEVVPLDDPSLKLTTSLDFAVLGDQTVIVDPGTRKILQIL